MLTRADMNAMEGKRKAYINAIPRSVLPRLLPKPIDHPKGDLWEVESVLRKKGKGSDAIYLVKWKGFALSEASWIDGPLPFYFKRHSKLIDIVSSDSDSDPSDEENEADATAFKSTNTFVDGDTEPDSKSEVDEMESDEVAALPLPPLLPAADVAMAPPAAAHDVPAAAPAAAHDAPAAVHYVTIDLVIPQSIGSMLNVSFNISVENA